MDLPAPLLSEQALKRHVSRLLAKNTSTEDAISFLGAGCYKRYIPAVCDEIANRSEFLTAYCGDTYSDHGKMQAIFEYASMMAELLELDVVSYPTYDAGQAVSSSFRMALRLRPGRNEILVPAHMNPEIRSQAAAYCRPFGTLVPVENPFGVLNEIKNAGSIFLGRNVPEALGDYFAGPNHTLPTSGTARFSSPLGVDDFVKKSSFLYYTREALGEVAPRIADFAEREGLHAHARSVTIRYEK